MKKLLVLVLITMFALKTYAEEKKKKVSEVTYKVEIDCQSCVNKIKKNIPFEKGVKDLKVDFEGQTVTVQYREDKTNKDNLKAAFEKLEFKAEEIKKGECTSEKKKCSSDCKH